MGIGSNTFRFPDAQHLLCPSESCCVGGYGGGWAHECQETSRLSVSAVCGAVLAGVTIYGLFSASIAHYEAIHEIVRGTSASVDTARIFGEFYPNPGDSSVSTVNLPLAMFAEGFGTFLLVLFVFALTEDCNVGRPSSDMQPLFIGLTVSSIIFFVAPITQCGLNPARDFGPRLVAYFAGWGDAALPIP